MDDITIPDVPEDLTSLSDEELADLGAQIGEAVKALADADLTDENIASIETLAGLADRIDTEAAEREEASAALAERREAALARFAPAEPEGEDEVDDAEAATVEDAEAATVETEAAATVETEVDEPEVVEAIAASAPKRPSAGTLAKIRSAAKAPSEPPAAAPAESGFRASFAVNGGSPADAPTVKDRRHLGELLAKRAASFGTVPAGVSEPISVATASWERPHQVGQDPVENFGVFRSAIEDANQALVASGPVATPLSPLYDFFRLAEPQTPVEDALPVVGAPRGGVRFIPGNCSRTAGNGAITIQTSADNTDPNAPDLKNVLHVPTSSVTETLVTAVSEIMEFGNLQYRTFPEQVANFTEDVAVAYAAKKETLYLDTIDAAATAVTGVTTGYGITRNLLWNYATAATNYRQRQGMKREALLQAVIPSWVVDAIILDLKLGLGDANFQASTAMVEDMFRRINVAPIWHNDGTTAGAGAERFGGAQAAGNLNAWPTEVAGYMFAPGEWVRMDGGTLDIGVVRDSTLNRRNDLQIFMEEWTGLVHYGCETLKLKVPVVVNGTGADATTPYSPA